MIPESFSRCAIGSSTSVPLTAMTSLSPFSRPYSMISKISSLSRGSPPVRMMVGLAKEAILSMTFLHSSVVSSPSKGPQLARARQCMQFRLQLRVSSHATILRGGPPAVCIASDSWAAASAVTAWLRFRGSLTS